MRAICWLALEAVRSLPRNAPERSEVVAVVVRCAMTGDTELQELALLVLGMWAELVSMHAALINAGVLTPLVLALGYPAPPPEQLPTCHIRGARALGCLSIHAQYRALMVDEGALPPLLALMRSSHPQVRLDAGRAVCNISSDRNASLELLRVGALSTVLVIARTGQGNMSVGGGSGDDGHKSLDQIGIEEAVKREPARAMAMAAEAMAAEVKGEEERQEGVRSGPTTKAAAARTLVQEYATRAVGNMLMAWGMEEEHQEGDRELLTKLRTEMQYLKRQLALTSSSLADEAGGKHLSRHDLHPSLKKLMPVEIARHVHLLSSVLHGWRYAVEIIRCEKELDMQDSAAGTLQRAERGHRKRRRRDAAVIVEAHARGMLTRWQLGMYRAYRDSERKSGRSGELFELDKLTTSPA